MTVRVPRRAWPFRRILGALGAALALASAPAPAEEPTFDRPVSSSEPRACPVRPRGQIDLGVELLRMQQQLAQSAPSVPGEGEMLNSRGYNYGGAGGAMVLPASLDAEAQVSR